MKFYQWLLIINNVGLWVLLWLAAVTHRVRIIAHPDGRVEYIGTLNKLKVNDTTIEEVDSKPKASKQTN